MYRGPVVDDHMHLDPSGQGINALRAFRTAGGTHALVVNKPYRHVQITHAKDFREEFLTTIEMAQRGADLVQTYALIGPHPAHYTRLLERHPRPVAHEIMIRGLEIAAELIADGLAIGFGEVGRPHYDVPEWVIEDCNCHLEHAIRLAKEIGCAVVIHSETSDQTFQELADLARRISFPQDMMVKHYSPPAILPEENQGLVPSILAIPDVVVSALRKGNRFMLETDFIDDPERPGAVLGPKNVPRTTKRLLENGIMSEEDAFMIHADLPSRVYGLDTG